VFFVADKPETAWKFAGQVRTKVGLEMGLIAENEFRFCWIVDFPMFEYDEKAKKIDFSHKPFLDAAGRVGGAGRRRIR